MAAFFEGGATRRKKAPSGNKAPTAAQTIAAVADKADLPKSKVKDVFEALADVVAANAKRHGAATIPGIGKVALRRKAATAARPGRNPFTNESIMLKAKPAMNVVRIRPNKALKDAVA